MSGLGFLSFDSLAIFFAISPLTAFFKNPSDSVTEDLHHILKIAAPTIAGKSIPNRDAVYTHMEPCAAVKINIVGGHFPGRNLGLNPVHNPGHNRGKQK